MPKHVLIIATLDTKGQESLYLKERLQQLGLVPLLMDLSLRGEVHRGADITPSQVAAAAGCRLDKVGQDRASRTAVNARGAANLACDLAAGGGMDGVIGLGGSTGSLMATDVMRALPFGLPKVMVSSTAALPGLSTRYIGTGDIALFHTVIEISGLSALLCNVLDRAALALSAMVQGPVSRLRSEAGKSIAMTMLGPCERSASTVRHELESRGYQVTGFSAAGIGDRAMEEMIGQGLFQGVVDLAPGGVGEHLFGFMRDAGPHRLESAGRMGIPQVVSTCSVNHMTPRKSAYQPDYHARRKVDLDRFRTWLRMSPDELKHVARVFAHKLNVSKGVVRVVIPLKGWSSVDMPGNPTYDPAEDRVFIQELRQHLRPDIPVVEVNANMEDPAFAEQIVRAALEIF